MDQTKVALIFLRLFVCFTSLSGCVLLERSGNSGYAYRHDDRGQASVASDRRINDRESAKAELGALSNERTISLRQALRRAEKNLEGKGEREQYYKAKPYLRDDAERLQYLRLESTSNRERFLASKGINGDAITHPPEVQSMIEQNDIAISMTRQAVRDAWGAPDEIDVAGNPIYGNEKWHFTEQVTSRDGFMTERRTVSFEGGRVVGWETR